MTELPTNHNAIEVVDFRKVYGSTLAAAGISFSLPAGTVGALVGPNGAGKTTTIRAVRYHSTHLRYAPCSWLGRANRTAQGQAGRSLRPRRPTAVRNADRMGALAVYRIRL